MSVGINSRMVAFVVHALAVVASVMVFVWSICYRGGFAWESTNKTLIFNLHPVLTLISLVILGGEAIISYKSLPFEKRANKLIHLVLHAIAIVLGILGIYAAFKHHNEKHIPNLYTIHSWVGIGVIVLYSLQWLYSFIVYFFPGRSSTLRREFLPWHIFLGVFVYVLAVGNSVLGFLEKLTFLEKSGLDKFGSEAFHGSMAIITILFGTFVLLIVYSKAPPSDEEDNYSYSAI
ncbi:transmembrane ascorbate ferrireductase 1-like isoform X1 [Raphanus sativus]|uniref:ascorbate ferrireductase (transmembrane) n=1 Tax=Raphanus sativus TaxID=3726 RepID=A0A6J0LXN2_RAPSA|nr:transmembrane ascorbate ferrireductase 1-like isoform X1 [Raphanus sativus]